MPFELVLVLVVEPSAIRYADMLTSGPVVYTIVCARQNLIISSDHSRLKVNMLVRCCSDLFYVVKMDAMVVT